MASMTMAGSLCRVKDFEPTGKWRHHQLLGAKLQQCKSGSTTHFAREVDVANTKVSYLHPPSTQHTDLCSVIDVVVRAQGTNTQLRPSRMFKITFKASKLEFLCPSEQECELWVSRISETARSSRIREHSTSDSLNQTAQTTLASSHKSMENVYLWEEDHSTVYSQEEPSFARSMSPFADRQGHQRQTAASIPYPAKQPHFARKLQYSQAMPTGSGSVGGLGVSVVMHQTGYPLVVELDPSGPAAQSGKVAPGDLIYAANGKHLNSMSLPDIVDSMVGEPGSVVELLVDHANNVFEPSNEVRSVLLTRQHKGAHSHPPLPDSHEPPHAPTTLSPGLAPSPPPPRPPHSPSGNFQSQSPPLRPLEPRSDAGKFALVDGVTLQHSLSSFYLVHSPLRVNRVPALVSEFVARGGGPSELDALNAELRSAYGRDLTAYLPPRSPPHPPPASASSSFTRTLVPQSATADAAPPALPKSALRLPNPQFHASTPQPSPADAPSTAAREGASGPELVEFNVGGQPFTTTRSTLARAPQRSLLASLLAPDCPLPLDDARRRFIDRDPLLFEPVLDFLRHGVVREYEAAEEQRRAVREAQGYGIQALADALARALPPSHTPRALSPPHDRALDSPSPRTSRPDTPQRGRPLQRNGGASASAPDQLDPGPPEADTGRLDSDSARGLDYASGRAPASAAAYRDHGREPPVRPSAPLRARPRTASPARRPPPSDAPPAAYSRSPALRSQSPVPLSLRHPPSLPPRTVPTALSPAPWLAPMAMLPPTLTAAPDSVLGYGATLLPPPAAAQAGVKPRDAGGQAGDGRGRAGRLEAEVGRVRALLEALYARERPGDMGKVDSLSADFEGRGGGEEEFETLNLSLRARFGVDLGPYPLAVAPFLPPSPPAPAPPSPTPALLPQPLLPLHNGVGVVLPPARQARSPQAGAHGAAGPAVRVVQLARSSSAGLPPSPGMLLEQRAGGTVVVAGLVLGGPAHVSGHVEVGDVVVEVDGVGVQGRPVEHARALLAGPDASVASLLLASPLPFPPAHRSPSPVLRTSASPLRFAPLPAAPPSSSSSGRPGPAHPPALGSEGERLRVWIRAGRHVPAELARLELFCTVEVVAGGEGGGGGGAESSAAKKKTAGVVYGGEDGEAVSWNSHCVLKLSAPHSACVFRLWCRAPGTPGAEPLHAGYAAIELDDMDAQHLIGREVWLPLKTMDGAAISRVPGLPLALAVTLHRT